MEQNPGAKFTFTMTLERVPGTNKVVVVVPEGAPFDMTTTISATGGMLPTGVSTVTVPVGRTRSDEIAITPLAGATVSLGAAPPPPVPPTTAFGGIKTAVANPLTIAGARALFVEDAQAPGLSVADAEVEEGAGATLAFAVTLSRAASGTVTVDYATSDGTATADYTQASGTLVFAAGETEKTVSVAVLDDAHDEGSETLTLTLSNASGAYIADGTATGAINNTDPMPQAWLARFARTVAEQVLEAVDTRLKASRRTGFEGFLAGRRIGVGAESGPGDPVRPQWRELTARDFVSGSSFALTRGTEKGGGLGRVVLGPGRYLLDPDGPLPLGAQ